MMKTKKTYKLTRAGKILVGCLAGAVLLGTGSAVYLLKANASPEETPVQPSALPAATSAIQALPTASSDPTPAPTPTSTPKPEVDLSYELTTLYDQTVFHASDTINEDAFNTAWNLMVAGGNADGGSEYEQSTITIYHSGERETDITMHQDGAVLNGGSSGHLYFTASSTEPRTISAVLLNPDNGTMIAGEDFQIGPEEKYFDMSFRNNTGTLYNGRIEFQLGTNSSVLSEHTVKIKSVRLVTDQPQISGRVNQIGYLTGSQKRVTFVGSNGDLFDVIDADSGSIVYCGAIVNMRQNPSTNEWNSYGDFTGLTAPGRYYIRSQLGKTSPVFEIRDDLFHDLQNDLIRMLNIQRCGESTIAPWSADAGHDTCHSQPATIYATTNTIDVRGGWHDAGDFGRYTKTGVKAVNDLLFAYLYNPGIYDDNANVSQSGNGVPDILDEARYELEWLLKMQGSGGAVYNTVITGNVPGDIDPAEDNQPLFLLYPETTSSADFAGAMATAYLVYQDIDKEFAEKCRDAADKAIGYFEDNYDSTSVPNPSDINGGSYMDESDRDGRFYAYIAMWCATNDRKYLDNAVNVAANDTDRTTGITWKNNGGFGRYLFLTNPNAEKAAPEFHNSMLSSLINEADKIMGSVNGNSYECSLAAYGWGSNADAANNGIILSMAYDFTGRQYYQQAAVEQLNYALGKNCHNMCFVTGNGTNYPHNLHNRLTAAKKIEVRGAFVAGSDAFHEDKITENTSWDLPEAVQYYDEYLSYSTNEMAIYYNSALIHLIARVRP